MGRHSRTAPEPIVVRHSGHRKVLNARRRKRRPVRTVLLTSAAALAVGAVGVSVGLLPVPNGSGGFSYRDAGATRQAQAGSGAQGPSQGGVAVPPGSARTTAPDRVGKRPGVPTATVTVTATATAPARPSPPRKSPAATWSPDASQPGARLNAKNTETQVIRLVNEQRAKVGCAPVTKDAKLGKLAEDFSKDMAKRDFFDHVDPDGKNPWDRAGLLGILNLGGENIARGQADASAVMDAWMNSAGHRANILNCDFHTLGVGFDPANGGPWWTQDFGY